MIAKISRRLAQQIVETVKDVCGKDVNFISPSGVIFASTSPQRVGEFHEIGQKAAQTGTVIEVHEDGSFEMIRRAETPRDYFATFDCFPVFEKLLQDEDELK